MKFVTTHSRPLILAGFPLKTSYASASTDIPAFWQEVMSKGRLSEIQSPEPTTIYAVYSEMKDEWRGEYRLHLAVELAEGSELPEGAEQVIIEAGPRAETVLPSAEPLAIVGAWQYIWEAWDRRDERDYRQDLEIYRGEAPPLISLSMRS